MGHVYLYEKYTNTNIIYASNNILLGWMVLYELNMQTLVKIKHNVYLFIYNQREL